MMSILAIEWSMTAVIVLIVIGVFVVIRRQGFWDLVSCWALVSGM